MPQSQPAQKPQSQQQSNAKKIEAYAAYLINEAVAKEKATRFGDSIADYLQAADLLLLLAKGTQDYTPWKTYSDKAIACQQRVRILIAKRKLAEEEAEAAPAPTVPTQPSTPSPEKV
jgi:hypothetical protein